MWLTPAVRRDLLRAAPVNHWFRYRSLRVELRFSLFGPVTMETIPHQPDLLYKNMLPTARGLFERMYEIK